MVKVIRRKNVLTQQAEELVTSTQPVLRTFALSRTSSRLIQEPENAIKKDITIKFDAYGNSTVNEHNIGLAFDHRVTWLRFDLDELIWNTETSLDDDYTEETKYDYYLFKLAFKNLTNEEISIYEFDGKIFQIPRGVTAPISLQKDGHITEDINYEVLLIIQEKNMDDPDYGNVKDVQETFVSQPWTAKVEKSSYVPGALERQSTESFQLHSLTKPPIVCKLSDIGIFDINHKILGNKKDDTISYFKMGEEVTAHLLGFNVFMRFEHADGELIYRQWEDTTLDEPDDYVETNPHILWVPSEVTSKSGEWTLTIIAYCGYFDLDTETKEDDINTSLAEIVLDQTTADANGNAEGEIEEPIINTTEDYYFYVSKDVVVSVEDNFLTQEDLKTQDGYGSGSNVKTSAYSNLETDDGLIFATSDDSILFGKEQ